MLSQERRKREGNRLIQAQRNLGSLKKIMTVWLHRPKDAGVGEGHDVPNDPVMEVENLESYREYVTLWKWLEGKAKEVGGNLLTMKMTPGGVRMSLEYLRMVHEDEMESFEPKRFRETCQTKLDDYLIWTESEVGKLCFRLEALIEKERFRRQAHAARRLMEEGIKNKDKKMVELWVKTNNLQESLKPEQELFKIDIVDEYDEKVE